MHLTQFSGYGLRVLIYTGLKGEQLSTIAEIAEAYGISRNHLMKVVQQLGSRGFLYSRRGKNGGVRLALSPDDIRIGAVVRAMEPNWRVADCMRSAEDCALTPACRLRRKLRDANQAFLDVLDEMTLAEVLHDQAHRNTLRELLAIESLTAPSRTESAGSDRRPTTT